MKKIFGILLCAMAFMSCDPNDTPGPDSPINNVDTVLKDVAYGTHERQVMDIYLPKGRSSTATKIIILIHGGAWSGGSKSDMNTFIPKLQAKWPEAAIANINYRLANGNSIIHTQITEDLKSAVNFLAQNSSTFETSDKMAMMGASAGAHLSLLYAYKYNDGNHVKAVSNLYGPSYFADWTFYNSFNLFLGGNVKEVYKTYVGEYWNTELYQSLSPFNIVSTTNYAPTITFHGDADVIVPVYQSHYFKNKLDSLGLNHQYHEYSGQGHGFNDTYNNDCVDKTLAFFKANM